MHRASHALTLALTALAFAGLAAFGVRQYDWNVSGLLHMDTVFGETHDVPPGVVLYEDGGYDGMLYYQVARDLPALFRGDDLSLDSAYRFQRIVLPLLTFGLALGREEWFPLAMLAINIAAVVGTLALLLSITKKVSIHALAGVFNPAAFVGMLYALTEPVSMFFLAAFLARWTAKDRRVDALAIVALTLSLFARETTVFFIGLLGLWYLWRREWKQVAWLAVPIALFLLWQVVLTWIAGAVPIETGGRMVGIPFSGPLAVIGWAIEETGMKQAYRFTSIGLLAFVLGACVVLARDAKPALRRRDPLWLLLAGLVAVMFCMHSHIWGVITSIGRVVTPLYLVYALYAAGRDTLLLRLLSGFLIVLSLAAAIGIAYVRHPFIVS